jgi:HEAT repeat protein
MRRNSNVFLARLEKPVTEPRSWHGLAPARRTLARAATCVVLAATTLAVPLDLHAKPKAAAKPAKAAEEEPKSDLVGLEKKLDGDEEEAVAALESIAESGNADTAPLLTKVLTRGGTPKVLEAALKAASKVKVPSLSAAIAPYVQHRSEDIRRAAVRALLKTKGPAAVDALRKGLGSPDAVVRGTAATGLGEIGAKESIDDLFRAFDHGVAEAGAAIGQLCTPEQCEKFAERTGRVAFDVMETGFDQILFRPSSEISDDQKIRLVGRLRELATPEVGKYLADVSERWPKDWSKKVKQAIDSAAHAIGGTK